MGDTKKEEAIATLIQGVKSLNETMPDLKAEVKRIAKDVEDVDVKGILESIDKLDAGMEKVKADILANATRSESGVPGLEDVKEFSIIRACMGVKMGGTQKNFEDVGGGKEFEVMKAVRQQMEKTGQAVGIDGQGGFFVPDQVMPDVIAAIYSRAAFIDLAGDGQSVVSVLDGLFGNTVTIPKAEGGCIAYWIGEEDDYAASKMKVGTVKMSPKKLGVLTKITHEMRRFQSQGFENLLRQDMVRALSKKLDHTIAYGTGTDNTPRGIVHMKGVQVYDAVGKASYDGLAAARAGVADWAAAELTFDGLDNIRGVLEDNDIDIDDGGSFRTISHPRYMRRLRQLKVQNFSGQAANQPYLLGAPMLKDSTIEAIIGKFGKTTQVNTTNKPGASIAGATTETELKSGDVFAGNMSEIVLGRWSGIEIEDDQGMGTGFVNDVTNIKMRMYADVGHRQDKAIVVCPNATMRD